MQIRILDGFESVGMVHTNSKKLFRALKVGCQAENLTIQVHESQKRKADKADKLTVDFVVAAEK